MIEFPIKVELTDMDVATAIVNFVKKKLDIETASDTLKYHVDIIHNIDMNTNRYAVTVSER